MTGTTTTTGAMLANLHAHAHTLDDRLRLRPLSAAAFDLPQQQYDQSSSIFHLEPLPTLHNPFAFRPLPEPRTELRELKQQQQPRSPVAPAESPRAPAAPAPPAQRTDADEARTDGHLDARNTLTQLLDLVASQTPTALFEWNASALRFQWRPPPAKKQRRSHHQHSSGDACIRGFSADTTLATSRPFIKTATLIRRAGAVLDALIARPDASGSADGDGYTHHGDDDIPREAHALVYALRQVLDWLRRELIEWQERHTAQLQTLLPPEGHAKAVSAAACSSNTVDDNGRALLILLDAASGLRACELILDAVSELLQCPFARQPPFKPLPGLKLGPPASADTRRPSSSSRPTPTSNPGALLSHIYFHASAASASAPSPLVRGVLAWVLEHTTRPWRLDVSHWIGWPLSPAASADSEGGSCVRPPIELLFSAGEKKAVREPWCGAQVEQERDERGELDTGYVLRPARIPAFVSLSAARQLLEAGRALHLLYTATDGQHPLLHLQRGHAHATSRPTPLPLRKTAALPVPTWTFGSPARAEQLRTLKSVLAASSAADARWVYHGTRKRVAEAGVGAGSVAGRASSTLGTVAGSAAGSGVLSARRRQSSLRAFPSRREGSLAQPPLPENALEKVHNALRVGAGESAEDACGPGKQEHAEPAGDGAIPETDADAALHRAIDLYDALPGSHLLGPPALDADTGGRAPHADSTDAGPSAFIAYLARFCEAATREEHAPLSEPAVNFVSGFPDSPPDDTDMEATQADPHALILPAHAPAFHLDTATRQTLLQPLLAWSRTVNAALVSVFFRDLAVDLYLATCQRFLLLGSEAFRSRVVGVLFEDGSEGRGSGSDSDRLWAKGRAGKLRQAGGVGLSVRLTSSSTWPPAGSELSVSLNFAVAETLAESKASHAKLMASSRPLLSTASLHAAEAALYDLDQRLSFSVIDMVADKPKSIHALDWLTLTFTPPPLISPLLQAHASACYQRLFNFLLRILRVQTVLRGLAKSTLLQSRTFASPPRPTTSGPTRSAPPPSIAHVLFTHDPLLRAALHAFRFEAAHFASALSTYVADVAIGLPWVRFQKRLRQLARGVGARTERRPSGGRAANGGTTARARTGAASELGEADGQGEEDEDDDGSSVWTRAGRSDAGTRADGGAYSASEDQDGSGDEDEEEDDEEDEADGRQVGGEGARAGAEEAFRLYNVFSLSRYHERVLDRMLQACFLKQRFRGIMKILNDLFQLILDLGQLIQDISATSETTNDEAPGDDDANAAATASYAAKERFYLLHARWKSRYALLAQSLRLVHLHSRTTAHHTQSSTAGPGQTADAHAQAKTQFQQALAAVLDLDASLPANTPASGSGAGAGTGPETEAEAQPPNVAELEMRRLEAEEELDLRALEDPEGRGESAGSNVSTAGILLNLLALPVS